MKKIWKGLIDYETAYHGQLELAQTSQEEIWGLEHPHVITLGKRYNSEHSMTHLAPFPKVITDRGGQATLHNPGQLIIYPQFYLSSYQLTVRTYVHLLLDTTCEVLKKFEVEVIPDYDQIGLFTNQGKIASFGIRIHKGRTLHGVAINVNNKLSDFQYVEACGVWNRPQDKLENWNSEISTNSLFDLWCKDFFQKI